MARKDIIESRIASLEEELVELQKFGNDIYFDGDVLIFRLRFPSSDTKYNYAAIKAAGKWSVTGNSTGSRLSWDNLVTLWRQAEKVKISVVTDSKRVL